MNLKMTSKALLLLVSILFMITACVTEKKINSNNIDPSQETRKSKVDSVRQIKSHEMPKTKVLYPPGTPKSEKEPENG